MIKRIVVINYLGEIVEMSLTNPEPSGFVVANISGLNPPKANINISDSSQLDGGYLTSTHVGARNIVFTLKFLPHSTIEECRLISYRLFPVKTNVTLLFETDHRTVQIAGVVEANDAEIFAKSTATKVSILCPRPYFQQVSKGYTSFGVVNPYFEFEFSNESLSEKLIEIGTYSTINAINIIYTGDVDTGGIFTIRFTGPCGDIIFSDGRGSFMNVKATKIQEKTGTAIGAGDQIVIDTISGEKGIYLVRNGATQNIFYCIDRYFEWMIFRPGVNTISYTATSGLANAHISVEYPIYYQGI